MRGHYRWVIVGTIAIAACGRTPVAPSQSTSSATTAESAAVSAVTGTVGLAVSQSAFGQIGTSPSGLTFSFLCPNGGNVTTTLLSSTQAPDGIATSSRMEFNDCRSQGVVIQGDPYLTTTATFKGNPSIQLNTLTFTTQTTGAVRMTFSGVEGRLQYDCSLSVTGVTSGSQALPQITATGTITLERPIGSTPRSMSCGPPAL